MGVKITTEEFIKRAKKIHSDKYDYSKVVYKAMHTKVIIICHELDKNGVEHGEYWQEPNEHLRSNGCKKCLNNVIDKYDFIWKSIQKHGYKYDYRKVNYFHSKTHVIVTCPIHGDFLIKPNNHVNGYGCSKCSKKYNYTTEEYINEAKRVHNNKYDYSKVNYVNAYTKICIICPEHGEFWQTPGSHLFKHGCPICHESKLEKETCNILTENDIQYIRQKRFSWLGFQSLDFYLPDYNIAIECQGKQHFEPVEHFGGENEFKKILERDERKRKLCKKNNIKLIEITDKLDLSLLK